MEAFLAEKKGLKQVVLASVNGTPSVGARVPMKELSRVAFIVQVAAAASDVLTVTLQQHNAASAGTTKVVAISNNYYHKVGAATSFTKVELESAASAYDLEAIAEAAVATFVFEVLQEDLDVANDFNFVSMDVVGDATARIIGIVAVGEAEYGPAYSRAL
jgi:hypothetical protein